MSPNVPQRRPFRLAPIDSQLSSNRIKSWASQNARIRSSGAGLPRMLTATTIRVRGVSAASSFDASMLSVSSSTSTNRSFNPYCCSGWNVVAHEMAGTMTSSPRCSGRFDR